jgi:uncharacterized repeat protein (TIGR03837 family)
LAFELECCSEFGTNMPRWDLFCKIVDNLGDIGVCWRLAQQLAFEYGADVRLWVDDLKSFSILCPAVSTTATEQRIGPIMVRHWSLDFPAVDAADVVIEAFACELPENYIAAMAARTVPPVWINLEYLSAEAWVEDCHLLASPHPRLPLTKYFFFPGFTSKTGGLLRENDLLAQRFSFDTAAANEFWHLRNIAPPGECELFVSLFCYENPALPELLQCWADSPTPIRVLATPGAASRQIGTWFNKTLVPGSHVQRNSLTVDALPFLSQSDYDCLLWACDINFVRGEDSFVRAQWAQKPFVWQIYPQDQLAHLVKLEAFLTRYSENFPDPEVVRRYWQAWNGLGKIDVAWRDFAANQQSLQRHSELWAFRLDQAGNLANNLSHFVRGK